MSVDGCTLPGTYRGRVGGRGYVRKMLEDMGVRIVEVEAMSHAAVYVEEVGILLVRTGASNACLARAADLILLDQVPTPHRAPSSGTT